MLLLAASGMESAHAERWTQASPTVIDVWYDADNVRAGAGQLISVWVSTGPNRTNIGRDGKTVYPTYTIIDCMLRTAGSKLSLDMGTPMVSHGANSGMGKLIERLCP